MSECDAAAETLRKKRFKDYTSHSNRCKATTTAGMLSEQDFGANCSIPNHCDRAVPAWLIILDNAPTAALFLLGTVLLWEASPLLSLLFFAYCCLSIILFWLFICPWCNHFGTKSCPCGYSRIAAGLFKRKTGRDFDRVFRRNIVVVFPCWFVPLGAGIYLLLTNYSLTLLFLFLAFCLVGFVLVPVISKFAGCRSCGIKDQCLRMSQTNKNTRQ